MRAVLCVMITGLVAFAGCLDNDEDGAPAPAGSQDLPALHDGVSVVALNGTLDEAVYRLLAEAQGTYFSIGASTFEPTIGATSTGGLFMSSYAGLGSGTHIRRSLDRAQTWDDATPVLPTGMKAVPNSNDPFIAVDPFTDRVYDFDMCLILSGFCVSYSDDDGATWTTQSVATGEQPALDHQSLAFAPATGGTPTVGYPSVLVFCINRGVTIAGSWCSSSFDGGLTWTPLVPGFPVTSTQCSGLSGHVVGSADGRFYRGNPSCSGPAVYRSDDGGLTWSEHTITTDTGVMGHEVATGVDEAGNVYAFWIGSDGLPYLAVSTDHAETWAGPYMVAAEGVTAAGFPTIAAKAAGRLAFAYIGTDVADGYQGDSDAMEWTGYLGIVVDALSDAPVVANVPVNSPDDPLDTGRACGAIRCGGFGDFIDITIDAEGRPWAALAHNGHDSAGIVGTLATGPSLAGNGTLDPLPLGGESVWG